MVIGNVEQFHYKIVKNNYEVLFFTNKNGLFSFLYIFDVETIVCVGGFVSGSKVKGQRLKL